MTARTHDYTVRRWGHNVVVINARDVSQTSRLAGWGAGIREGDYLVLPNAGAPMRVRVETVTYMTDPPDQWFAEVRIAPEGEA